MTKDLNFTGIERHLGEMEVVVTKTDLKGQLTYCNDVFLRVTGFSENECLGKPHNIIRHPRMPRYVFYLLWETIKNGKEIFVYVMNRSKCGDHYWVNAHITPSFDKTGRIIGYHSNRRAPNRKTLEDVIIPLYKDLLAEEQRHTNQKEGIRASAEIVKSLLSAANMQYDEFIARLMFSDNKSPADLLTKTNQAVERYVF